MDYHHHHPTAIHPFFMLASMPSDMLMPERLIRRLLLLAHIPHHDATLLPCVRLLPCIRLLIPWLRAWHALIIRIVAPPALPIAIALNAIAASGAAAAREQPEEARGPTKRHGQPRPDIDIAPHGAVDVVVLERGVEGAGEGGVEDGGG